MSHWVLEKPIFKKSESKFGDQVTYQGDTVIKPYHPSKPVYLQFLLSE